MENNIFLRNKKKFNPDVMTKLKMVDNDRNQTKFNRVTTIYNPITNIIPEQIKNQDDLKININEKINIKERLLQIEKDRNQQDIYYKSINQSTTKIFHQNNINSHVNNFDDLKKISTNQNNNNDKVNNIIVGLKDMGLLTK
jgi:hypothetical protein